MFAMTLEVSTSPSAHITQVIFLHSITVNTFIFCDILFLIS